MVKYLFLITVFFTISAFSSNKCQDSLERIKQQLLVSGEVSTIDCAPAFSKFKDYCRHYHSFSSCVLTNYDDQRCSCSNLKADNGSSDLVYWSPDNWKATFTLRWYGFRAQAASKRLLLFSHSPSANKNLFESSVSTFRYK